MASPSAPESGRVSPAGVADSVAASIKPEVIREILTSSFQDSKTRLSPDTLPLMSALAKSLAVEATLRACAHVLRDGSGRLDLEHVEKCLPQLMLDFP